jgi:hypothetical protein
MVTYNLAYRLARISKWEQMARDRDRFQMRIHNTEKLLIKVFNPAHRDYMLAKRESVSLLSQRNHSDYDSKAV